MLDQKPSDPRSRRAAALVGLAALALAASGLVSAPASAAPAERAAQQAVAAGIAPSAVAVHEVHARAGRAGAKLRKIYVTLGVSSSEPAEAGHPRAMVQQRRSGTWRTVDSVVVRDVEGPPVSVRWRSTKAATLRVLVPSLRLVSPTMKVPAAPSSTKSRYYVRADKVGDGGSILRVFKGGVAYGISYASLEFSCLAGALDRPWLRLVSHDFGGWRVKYRTSGSWKRLTIHDGARPVGGPRTSLSGKSKRLFRFCAAPTYASVSTDPTSI